MTLEELIVAKFSSVFNDRLWFNVIPKSQATQESLKAPFCLVQQVSDRPRQYVSNDAQEYEEVRMQFFVWGEKDIAVRTAMNNLRDAVLASNVDQTWQMRAEGGTAGEYNEVLELRGLRRDYSIVYAL